MTTNQYGLCEECGEPIRRTGTQLDCVNGCFEDDVRNLVSGDEWEESHYGENASEYLGTQKSENGITHF